jgi:NADH:ubiquinone oxidoreductase subunit D
MPDKEEIIETRQVTMHMGPQHPSTHGVLHIILNMQGETIVDIEPDIGYLHRGTEKIAESLLYHQFTPYTDRLDYMSAMSNNLAYVQAVEKLLDIEITDRAKYIRVIAAELSRIAGHLLALGAWALDLGAMSILLYAMREREVVLDIFEMICGARMTLSYLRVGGCATISPPSAKTCERMLELFPPGCRVRELLIGNRIWIQRNRAWA